MILRKLNLKYLLEKKKINLFQLERFFYKWFNFLFGLLKYRM